MNKSPQLLSTDCKTQGMMGNALPTPDQKAAVKMSKNYVLTSFPNHFSLTSMENVTRSRKDVKENSEGVKKRQPWCSENPTALH